VTDPISDGMLTSQGWKSQAQGIVGVTLQLASVASSFQFQSVDVRDHESMPAGRGRFWNRRM